jgi:hypothetical protein
VVGDGQAVHAEFFGLFDELRDLAGAVEKGVMGMNVKMNESIR